MDARILRWCVAVAIVVMLLLAVPVIAHAAPGGGKGSGPDSTECQHTTTKLFDEKYEPEFNNSLGSYTNMSAYL